MSRTPSRLLFVALLLSVASGATGRDPKPDLPYVKGPYLGQGLPGKEPLLFAPGRLSTGLSERDLTMTPDGGEIYFGLSNGEVSTIMVIRRTGGAWREAEVAPFARDLAYRNFEPCLSADGKRIFFLSTRPPAGQEPRPGWGHQNIWAADRRPDGGWGEPYDLGPPVNTGDEEFYPSVTRDGTLYFTRTPAGKMEPALYRSRLVDGRFATPEKLPEVVGALGMAYNATVDRDERFLIACVAPGGEAGWASRYVVFFRRDDGSWTGGVDLGEPVNQPGGDATSASLSPDGKYLFFASRRADPLEKPADRPLALHDFEARLGRPRNGASDIYWVDAGFLKGLREKALAAVPAGDADAPAAK